MEIEKIVGLALVASVLAILVKNFRPEISIGVSVVTVGVLLAMISPYIKTIFNSFTELSEMIGLKGRYLTIIMKTVCVAYISQLGAEICRDAGENAIGTKVEICGKVIIAVMSLPMIFELFRVIEKIIEPF